MIDLFGNEHPDPAPKAHTGPKVQLDLLTHAAERAALATGRPVSQERTEIVAPHPNRANAHPTTEPNYVCDNCGHYAGNGPHRCCTIHKTPLLLEAGGRGIYSCPRCA